MISPIETNGMISITQDISTIRQNEETRSEFDNLNFHNKLEQKQEQNLRTVREADNSDKSNTRHDAKEKGKNEYFNLRKNVKKKSQEPGEKVVAKSMHGFDIKI